MPGTHTLISSSGAIRLSKDFAKLVNNPVGSDIRFLVGGASVGEKQRDIPTTTFYGHSLILRFRSKYFATLYDNDWKEKSDGIFKKPNVSPVAFHALLYYVYTGSVEVVDSSLLPELIAAAEEMELNELSNICQSRLIKELKESSKNISKDDKEVEPNTTKNFENGKLPFGLAVRTLLIPSLVLAYDHTLEILYGELLEFALQHMEIITTYKNTFNTFLEKIPIAIFKQILTADSLALKEYDVWQLTLSWACHKTNIMKSALETQLKLNANEYYEDDYTDMEVDNHLNQPLISAEQFKNLKSEINPLLSAVRFTLMEPEQYSMTVETLNYFVPARRLHEIQRFFSKPGTISHEVARNGGTLKSTIANHESEELLRQWIYESNVISGCSSLKDLKFVLLFRASIHGYQASAFHNHCDNKGPTLVLVRSSNGRLFGGVNFDHWSSNSGHTHLATNFLFALKDRKYRTQPIKFPYTDPVSCRHPRAERDRFQLERSYYDPVVSQYHSNGPIFGANDLCISDNANTSNSFSNLPQSYNGNNASDTALAGAQYFTVADYEVFSISKK